MKNTPNLQGAPNGDQEENEVHANRHSTQPPASSGRVKILVVDDNPVNRRVVSLQLEQLGFRADCAESGEVAVRLGTARRYHLILMDVQMPGMDGLTATRTLLAALPIEHQPLVVAMTGDTSEEDRETCLAAGMLDMVSKPIRTAELVRVVRSAREGMMLTIAATRPQSPLGGLLEAFSLRPDVLRGLLTDYIQDSETLFAGILQCIARKDAQSLEEKAHALKGTAGQMGAREVALFAALVERAARTGSYARAEACAKALGEKLSTGNQELWRLCEEKLPRRSTSNSSFRPPHPALHP